MVLGQQQQAVHTHNHIVWIAPNSASKRLTPSKLKRIEIGMPTTAQMCYSIIREEVTTCEGVSLVPRCAQTWHKDDFSKLPKHAGSYGE